MTATQMPAGPVSSTGHRWPCTRLYILSTEHDMCTCGAARSFI